MDVSRQKPPIEKRSPNRTPQAVQDAYKKVVTGLFTNSTAVVTKKTIREKPLKAHLKLILARQKKYRTEVGAET